MSRTLKKLPNDPKIYRAFPISTIHPPSPTPTPYIYQPSVRKTIHSPSSSSSTAPFIHVVSLKGAFLYVAPSVRRVLVGAGDLVGKSVAGTSTPEDVVPLMRGVEGGSARSGRLGIGNFRVIPYLGAETTKVSGWGGRAVVPAVQGRWTCCPRTQNRGSCWVGE